MIKSTEEIIKINNIIRTARFYNLVNLLHAFQILPEEPGIMNNRRKETDSPILLVCDKIRAFDWINRAGENLQKIFRDFPPSALADEYMKHFMAGLRQNMIKTDRLCHMSPALTLYKEDEFFAAGHK